VSSADPVEHALIALGELYLEIDRNVRRLTRIHAERLQCRRGCSACCLDGLTVTRIEAEKIRRGHGDLLSQASPHSMGACAFLDQEGACRIYEDRPTICRSQGLPLRVVFENEVEEVEERRDICPLNIEGGPALDALPEEDLWLVGPEELRVQQLDEMAFAGDGNDAVATHMNDDAEVDKNGERVALRDLFHED
jgi:Fe-S-cluster containining protein